MLHLGNLEFKENSKEESSIVNEDRELMFSNSFLNADVSISTSLDFFALPNSVNKHIARLMGVDAQKLADAFCNPKLTVAGETVITHLTEAQASNSRHALTMVCAHFAASVSYGSVVSVRPNVRLACYEGWRGLL